jgi:hypothetical protein
MNPEDRIILTSYEADFAATWGSKVRDIFKEHKDVFGVNVNDKNAARNRWDIADHRGGMGTAGVGGPITGKGAEILIIDDPVKNAEQANSPTYREKAKDWFNSTAYTRLTPTGKVILIMTRWHEDDLGGKFLLQRELKLKGIDGGVIASTLDATEIDELAMAMELIQKRRFNLTDNSDRSALEKEKARAFRFLSSKGFNKEIIYKAVLGQYNSD